MFYIKRVILVCVLIGFNLFFLPRIVDAEIVLEKDETHQAIVKINTITQGLDGFLTVFRSGTGVIIDQKGIILTNKHVATVQYLYDDSEAAVGYQICLTGMVDEKPDCSYMAQLIATDEATDLALLQIIPIAGLSSRTDFPYLQPSQTGGVRIGDAVSVLGYPSVGGDTISLTQGIVSGMQTKYDRKWIKTDAVVSFGSSGGALISSAGQLVGVTTEVSSDLAASLGYAIDVSSVSPWINANKSLTPSTSTIQQRVALFTKKQKNANESDTFSFDEHSARITKPNGWEFLYPHEDRLFIYNPTDPDSGFVSVALADHDYPISFEYNSFSVRSELASGGGLALANFVKDEIVSWNGVAAKHIKITGIENSIEQYFIPNQDVGIQLIFGYGENDKDLLKVNAILSSISVGSRAAPILLTQYSNQNPAFNIKTNADWYIGRYDSKSTPFHLVAKDYSARVIAQVEKKTDSSRFLSNDEILTIKENEIKNAEAALKSANVQVQLLSKNAHVKLGDSATDTIQYSVKISNIATGQVLTYTYAFIVPVKDDYLFFTMQYIGSDAAKFEEKVNSLKNLLSTLSIEGAVIPTTVDGYNPTQERDMASSISADKRLSAVIGVPQCESNTLIKGVSSTAVYYCGSDGKRYVFPNQQTYMTWYENFDGVKTISDGALAKIAIGGAVTYRPGVRMIKIATDSKVYAVGANGKLRPIASEEVAVRLYGPNWNKMIDDISDAYFITYHVGAPLN